MNFIDESTEKAARILIVDDVVENIRLATEILRPAGYAVSVARNGVDALRIAETSPPDLILLDVVMPVMDGFECCVRLKTSAATREIPVVFVTAGTDSGDIIKAFELGALDYVSRPFRSAELLARIQTHVSLRRMHQDLKKITEKASHYISPHLFRAIFEGEKNTELSSNSKPLTIFFSDIVNFTEQAERLGDDGLAPWLNHYCERMASLVLKHGGTLDKFIGDAVMAFFGDPHSKSIQEDAVACVRMAQGMLSEAAAISPLRVQIRMGIHSGPAHVGNFGSRQQMNYTAIGRAVNIAARLEGASQPGRILISGVTRDLVKDHIKCTPNGPVALKGINGDIDTWWVDD